MARATASKLWARLRFKGIRTSRRRVLRLMREHGLLAPQRMGAPHGSKAHDGRRITTDRVDAMWGADLTSAMTSEGHALLHDHGSQYVSHDFQAEIRFLGIGSSPAFVREPEGNGCAERFIRVLKENLLWVRCFNTIEELRLALQAFRQTYNRTWIIERHGYKTPAQVRADQLGHMPMAA